jgi:hypothetical protein
MSVFEPEFGKVTCGGVEDGSADLIPDFGRQAEERRN